MNAMTLTAHGPWHDGDAPGWWPVFPIGFGLFWLLVLGGGFYLLSKRTKGGGAEKVLAERYARGEIDEEEYRERLGVLRS
ncbi:SHOCT domain-containing protein [Actinomadura sp. DC4]|uniref:SHOCT domain-containing protein n=1 Tax=Actinomadura sp. DC4 TaxID=3055069 RepID=UPI0025B1652A|nr:SHOCT domain-containing protein [Actinomadura sp. DC4]MDN3359982.1 SHOCT domain-containing protein [Actinomadura sp. DC4]